MTQLPHDNPLLEAALGYAALGYSVFPIAPGGKKPLTEHGFKDASTDPALIERWWRDCPRANVAMPTEGLLVVDVDGADNRWLTDDAEKLIELARGPVQLTPGGGRQYFHRQPEGKNWRCTTGRLAARVDTRADGGYVVVAPSVRQGGAYRWVETMSLDCRREQLPEPPAWLAAMLDTLAAGSATSAHVASGSPDGNVIPSGQRNATLARLAGGMRRMGMSQAEMTAALLATNRQRCRPPVPEAEVERIAASVARYEPDQVSVALVENHWDQMYAEPVEAEETPAGKDPGPLPDELLRVPGLINELADHCLATAPYPNLVMAFAGALSLQAFLAGRKVRDPGDNRTNLYLLGLAFSSSGKDWPRRINTDLLWKVGLGSCLGDKFASGEGIQDALFQEPSMLFQTDEIDGMLQSITHSREARYESTMTTLLTLFSSSASVFPMRRKAGKDHPGVIDQPSLVIFGTAIPNHYYEALSERMLTNGFFARMLVLESHKRAEGQEPAIRDLPERVVETARWWAEFRPYERRGNLLDLHPVPRIVEQSGSARRLLVDLRKQAEAEYSKAEDRGDQVSTTVWGRVSENTRKLALVYAVSENHLAPVIGEAAVRWAGALVMHQTRRMLFMASEHVARNDYDAKCKELLRILRQWQGKYGDEWMPFWRLNRKLPWAEWEHDEVRKMLVNQKLIDYDERKTSGTPQRVYRLTATR